MFKLQQRLSKAIRKYYDEVTLSHFSDFIMILI